MGVRQGGERFNVADGTSRIPKALAEQRFGVLIDRPGKIFGRLAARKMDRYALSRQNMSEQCVSGAIKLWRGDDIPARVGDVCKGVV